MALGSRSPWGNLGEETKIAPESLGELGEEQKGPFVLPAALGEPVRTFTGIVLPCPPTSGVERSGRQSFMRLPSSRPQTTYVHNTQAPAILRCPPSSHARHPHTLHVLEAMIPHIAFSYSKWRYLLVVEEKEMKSFTGCCPLEDLSRVCTPSHHCPY
jgi:hypothetical protein